MYENQNQPQNGYGSQPGYGNQQFPPQPKRKTNGCLITGIVVAVLFVLVVGGCSMAMVAGSTSSGGGDSSSGSSGGSDASNEGGETLKLGDTGTTGSWKVTVQGIDEASEYGPEYAVEQAQGVFKVVKLDVENAGSEATTFDSSAVTLVDADGKEYSSQTMLGSDDLFLEQINPGNKVEGGEAVIDVPEKTDITEVRVEDVMSLNEPIVFDVSK